jgi:predicted Fe-Mo cluster-binding NifX family protein
MKIAVTAQGQELDSAVDPRFGRAEWFLVVDTETGEATAHSNEQNLSAPQGAGIQAARIVIELAVAAVLSGNVGPKAFATLQAGNVAIYTGASGSVRDAVEQFNAGSLKAAEGANVDGHWV